MARTATGMSKKSNRDNAQILNLCWAWRDQFGIGVKMDAEFAWVVSNGKFGSKPAQWGQAGNFTYTVSEPTVDTWIVAKHVWQMTA